MGDLQTALRSGDSWPIKLLVHQPQWHRCDDLVQNRPECFQLRSDGSRNPDMLCYGNPRTLQTYLEHCEAGFDRGEETGHRRPVVMDNSSGTACSTNPNRSKAAKTRS